jgi:predicted ATPase/class 3 adenylate cyclase/Tfp pilus assembly protein PilF
MSSLPLGTVTFLFTDIEGSTRLLQRLGDKYATLIAEHDRLLRDVWQTHNGRVVGTQGDSFFVAFGSAIDGVNAAVQAQRALALHPWIEGVKVRVRMGLHTGEPQIRASENYVGIDVHRAARIAAAAHGGQVLISQMTLDLVRNELPESVTWWDLGEHRLKDLRQPKHLYQLVIAGMPSEFPPLKSLDAFPNNLPVQSTSFVGRAKEVAEVRQLLSEGRLVTLTGPGGTGKTRLALHVASEMLKDFHGVFFVALAPITDPGLVASTMAQALHISETPGRSIFDSLKEYLQSKSFLLVLDNFEQVISAAPLVSELLEVCPGLKILVTSREGLRVSGEHEYPVPPLALPDPVQLPSPESFSQFAAVDLFIQRARAVKPDFQVTTETAPAVAEICYRLDGLPLAIELAAARIKLLPPPAMLKRLDVSQHSRLEFLTGGGRDRPARQQTLRDAIAWSYDLLEADEQKLFRQLSVFVGGCTLEAAEMVAGGQTEPISMLDRLGSLLDKSLLFDVEDRNAKARFGMLGMLREFGLEQLEAKGEGENIRLRHANFFLALAEQAEASAEQVEWMDRMEREHDNLRAALEWSKAAKETGELCVRLAGALGHFWEVRGHFSEGRERLSAVLSAETAQGQTAGHAKLLARAAELAYRQSDYPATISFAKESLAIYRKIEDKQGIASALVKLGNAATETGNYRTASKDLEEALSIWREVDDKHGMARALISLGWAALRSGNHALANGRLEEALAFSRELGDARSMGFELSGLGEVALRQGDYSRARQLMEESLELRRQLGNKWGVGVSLGMLGWVAMRERDWDRATERLAESLEVRQEIGDKGGSAWCLERLAGVAMAQGHAEKAVRLFGAAAALRASIGSVIDPADQAKYERNRNSLRAKLGRERFKAVWEDGFALTLEQAVAYALERQMST